MLKGFWAMGIKEFRQVLRDKTTIFIAIMIPAIQLTIFGYAIRTDITNVKTVIADLSQTELSREIITAINNTGVFKISGYVLSYGDAYDSIRNGTAKLAILIPPDLRRGESGFEPSEIQILVDGSDSSVANYALSAIEGAITAFLDKAQARLSVQRMLTLKPRVLFNPELKSSTFFVPALIVLILHIPLVILTSLSVVRERVEGTLEQLIVTPIGKLALMLGKLVPFFVIGVFAGVGVLLVMVFLFKVPIHGSLVALVLVMLLWIITSLALGLMLSTIARTQLQAILSAILIIVPSILLSGFMFPRESMPKLVYPITYLLPMTYAIRIVRGIVIRGAPTSALLIDLGVLAFFCILLVSFSTIRFQKRLQ